MGDSFSTIMVSPQMVGGSTMTILSNYDDERWLNLYKRESSINGLSVHVEHLRVGITRRSTYSGLHPCLPGPGIAPTKRHEFIDEAQALALLVLPFT